MSTAYPVIIVGAPRSGTSLLQKIIREHNGFRSVAKESGFIWWPYTHPKHNDWEHEGWQDGTLSEKDRYSIICQFDRYAFSANTWRMAAPFNIMRYQRSPALAPVLRAGYRLSTHIAMGLRQLNLTSSTRARLVDKSVHSPLFLPLIRQVFPNARFIHIVRDGRDTVTSMLDGWLNPDRFFTYSVPGGLSIPDYPHQLWNFALPPKWREWRTRPLADVVAFQWLALQEAVFDYFNRFCNVPMLRIHLEDLVSSPDDSMEALAEFIDLPKSQYLDNMSSGLPRINSRPDQQRVEIDTEVAIRMKRLSDDQNLRIERMNEKLGYK